MTNLLLLALNLAIPGRFLPLLTAKVVLSTLRTIRTILTPSDPLPLRLTAFTTRARLALFLALFTNLAPWGL